MDTVFLAPTNDESLPRFLEKLGYDVIVADPERPVVAQLVQRVLDAIIVDGRGSDHYKELCEFLRSNEPTKNVPILLIVPNEQDVEEIKALNLDKVDLVLVPFSIGSLAGRLATRLRMGKIQGLDPLKASLAEVNATLRDLNLRMRKERDEARVVQQALLPASLPKSEAYEIAAIYQPLDEVGGDWYFSEVADEKVLLGLADVTGHGLAAAFLGAMTKLAMFAAGSREPASLLSEVNRLMAPHLPDGRFVTMLTALYDPVNGLFSYTNAGHPPCIMYSSQEGIARELPGKGFPIGFLDDSVYTAHEAILEPGDVIVLLTDGLTEAQNRSAEMYGTKRLLDLVTARASEASTQELSEEIMADLHQFKDGRILKDDVTIMTLKRTS